MALLLLATAALCVPINQGFFLSASRLGPTSHVGIFYATCPLVVLLLAWTMRMERPDRNRLWGVLASVAGIAVIGIGSFLEWRRSSHRRGSRSRACRLLARGCCTFVGRLYRNEQAACRASRRAACARRDLPGRLSAFCPAGDLDLARPEELRPGLTVGLAGTGGLGLFITPLGWAFQNLSLRRFDASQVATFSNGSPFLTVVWGIWLFGELLTPALVAGGALTLGGIYWASRAKKLTRNAAPFRTADRAG